MHVRRYVRMYAGTYVGQLLFVTVKVCISLYERYVRMHLMKLSTNGNGCVLGE
ncbi:hypothetical protein HanRHA438_Chr04g0201541 [Helianthus annuus]|nr:hypothetical protein HanRHA438_Chr04g0201541 [Helianthus annuus]